MNTIELERKVIHIKKRHIWKCRKRKTIEILQTRHIKKNNIKR